MLDISTNGGGSSDIVLFITSLFCNKADMYYENTLTGQKIKPTYELKYIDFFNLPKLTELIESYYQSK